MGDSDWVLLRLLLSCVSVGAVKNQQQYQANPSHRQLPPIFHEDSVWSQEVLRRLISGEVAPQIVAINQRLGLFGQEVPPRYVAPAGLPLGARAKQEKTTQAFQSLKRGGPVTIDIKLAFAQEPKDLLVHSPPAGWSSHCPWKYLQISNSDHDC